MLDTLVNDGYLRIPSAVSQGDVQSMQDRLWGLMTDKGANRDAPETWRPEHGHRLQAIRKHDPSSIQHPVLKDALNEVFADRSWHANDDWGQALITMPTAEPWRVPPGPWHFDWPHLGLTRVSGVNLFLFVDHVEEQGGGPVAVKSSPAVTAHFYTCHPEVQKMSDVNRAYARFDPWLIALTTEDGAEDRNQRFMDADTLVHGSKIRVVELTGRAGDVIVGHPGLFHAPAPNVSERVRMMRVQRIKAID